MAMSNQELTDELRDLKKRVKALEELVDYTVWQRALTEAKLDTVPSTSTVPTVTITATMPAEGA